MATQTSVPSPLAWEEEEEEPEELLGLRRPIELSEGERETEGEEVEHVSPSPGVGGAGAGAEAEKEDGPDARGGASPDVPPLEANRSAPIEYVTLHVHVLDTITPGLKMEDKMCTCVSVIPCDPEEFIDNCLTLANAHANLEAPPSQALFRSVMKEVHTLLWLLALGSTNSWGTCDMVGLSITPDNRVVANRFLSAFSAETEKQWGVVNDTMSKPGMGFIVQVLHWYMCSNRLPDPKFETKPWFYHTDKYVRTHGHLALNLVHPTHVPSAACVKMPVDRYPRVPSTPVSG